MRVAWAVAGSAAVLVAAACSAIDGPAAPRAATLLPGPVATLGVAAGGPRTAATPGAVTAAGSVTITAVGDTMLGNTPGLPPDPAGYLDAVKPILDSGTSIVFGNLEGTLTTATTSKCGASSGQGQQGNGQGQQGQQGQPSKAPPVQTCFAFRDPPDYAQYYKQAGFTVLNDANNHSFDFGPAGQAQTVQAIHAAGLAQTGLPGEITIVTANRIKVAILGFAPYDYDASLLDLPRARALIVQAGREAQVVVVYMHAGAEGPTADHVTGQEEQYLGEDRGNAQAFAHMAIDAGASLVIASGPHVLRGMQFYKGHLICYSLGNFAGYGDFATGGDRSLSVIFRATLSSAGQFENARVYPIQLSTQGQPAPGGGAIAFIAGLSAADFGSTAARILPSGTIEQH
jgi:poly-gamma-glutamate capsule biosynthesis protein CapA/YwtB (metallophosphatase superfamily)